MEKESKFRKIFAVPHFHYDVEWWKTDDGYDRDVDEILTKALEMLERHHDFKYVIDQALALRPFWRAHPDKQELIRKLVKDGRIELVGGTFCAPDENIPTGEAFARQFLYGKRFLEGEVGGKVVSAWEIDEFGHPSQTPQIAAKAGMESFTFARGIQNWEDPSHPTQFYWESPDGTQILTHWFAAQYTGMTPVGNRAINLALFRREMKGRVEHEGERARSPFLMIPFGSDFTVPTEDWLRFVEEWNAKELPPIEFGLPRDYFAAIRESELPVVRGEFNPLLDGCYETREKVKRYCRMSQYGILDAEKLATVAYAMGEAYPAKKLDEAWERILENDFHDIVCGTGTDMVYRNTLKRYEEAVALTATVRDDAVAAIAANVDTKVSGTPVVVCNTLNHARRDVARIPLAKLPKAKHYRVIAPDGRKPACGVSGGELLFIAEAPAFGYAVYTVETGEGAKKRSALKVDGMSAENEYYRLTMDKVTGGIKSIVDKKSGKELLDTRQFAANEIVVEEDVGNLWTIHKTGEEWRAKDYKVEIEAIDESPVRVGFVSRGKHESMDRTQRVYLYAGMRRVEFETELDFRGKDRRVKVMFAPALDGAPRAAFETPFCTDERADGHWCAQNWVDVSDGDNGLAVMNAGNPGHDVEGNAIGMVLMRSVSMLPSGGGLLRFVKKNLPEFKNRFRKAAYYMIEKNLGLAEWALYDFHGLMLREWASAGGPPSRRGLSLWDHVTPWFSANKESDAWERGAHSFRYSILPHDGDWKAAEMPHRGLEFNSPLIAQVAEHGRGKMARTGSFLKVESKGNAILTALKKAEHGDDIVARIYDAYGADTKVRLDFFKGIKKCRKTNLTEDGTEETIRVRQGQPEFTLGKWEISTVEFR